MMKKSAVGISGGCALLIIACMGLIVVMSGGITALGGQTPQATNQSAPTQTALQNIPHGAKANPAAITLEVYQQAAARECPGKDIWPVLAAVGQIESQHNQSSLPGVHNGANSVGAMGPLQFLQGTWDHYKVAAPGHAVPDVYNPEDAAYSAANMLCQNGAGGTPAQDVQALWDYSHDQVYANQAESLAESFSVPVQAVPTVLAVVPAAPSAAPTAAPSATPAVTAVAEATPTAAPPPPPAPVQATQSAYGESYCDYKAIWCSSRLDAYGDGWGFSTRECVSYVAWKRRQVGLQPYPLYWGSAYQWTKYVDHRTNPQPGDIAVWGAGANRLVDPNAGHVAFVQKVFANGTIVVEQYNYDIPGTPPGVYSETTIRPRDALWQGIGFISGHP